MALATEAHLAEGHLQQFVNTKKFKFSEISIQHMKADSFQKGRAKFRTTVNIK